jgi:hypothetical protein
VLSISEVPSSQRTAWHVAATFFGHEDIGGADIAISSVARMTHQVYKEGTLKRRTPYRRSSGPGDNGLMQRFIAELSKLIETAEFERSWQNDSAKNPNVTVAFAFAGRRVTITIDSLLSPPWRSDDFHRTFSGAIHRVDQHCNIRWL